MTQANQRTAPILPAREITPTRSGTFPVAERPEDRGYPSLDAYDPEVDAVAPISVRTSFMELLWVCGDCGEHYPRMRSCPEQCKACGAPKQNFYAPVED
jgi:rubrerythrin